MNTPPPTPTPNRLHHYEDLYYDDEYHPNGRRDLNPIFELVLYRTRTNPNGETVRQKAYYGRVRLRRCEF